MSAYQGRFTGRTAVVTGGASGLGKASAARIVAEGGKVVLWDLNSETLKAAAEEVGAVATVALDVADPDAVAAAAAESHQALGGRIDILVASAGITGATVPVHEFPLDSWKRVVDINLNGVFYCCRAVTPTAMATGRTYAAVYYAPFLYNESWWWDTTAQQDRVNWSLYADAVATYPGAAAMSGFIAGGESFSGPTIPWPHAQTGGPMTPLLVDVSGYAGSGPPAGYDWLVHPTTLEQLLDPTTGDDLIWAA
ncbi:SDR family NAD(P)-dependent oxidoreductase [Brevundimonas sp. CEF1]|uniref:SDR family NAD(P)-dependent oxidoreductase n=1 Tax=Brevundimonas sp. CEF1 TaxID=3442642 RepID=UPI003F513FC4